MGTSRSRIKRKQTKKAKVKQNHIKRYAREEVAKRLKVDPRRMEVFHREGLFEYADKAHRWVDAKNFERLRLVVELQRDLGVNMAGLDVILAMREKMKLMREDINRFLGSARRELKGKLVEELGHLERSFEIRRRSR